MNTHTQEHLNTQLSKSPLNLDKTRKKTPAQESYADVEELSKMLSEQQLRLTRFVRKHLRNDDHIGDVVQQACFEAYRNWGNFKGESRAETWLFGIAFNLMRNFKSKQYRFNQTFEPLEDSHFENLFDETEQPMETIMRREQVNQLGESIEQLHIRMRSVVSCVLLEGLSYQETAEKLDLPVGTVRSRLSRARDTLRELMDEPKHS